jgi:hypothetical protein
VRRLSGNSAEVNVIPRADLAQQVEQATRAQAVALALFAGLAAVAALVVIGQILTRELSLAAAGQDTVRALGASRPQLFAATMLPLVLVVALGGLIGAGIAVLASPLTPMGLAHRAEPTPGPTLHLAGLGLGVLGTLALLGGLVAVPAWRLTRARSGETDGRRSPPRRRPGTLELEAAGRPHRPGRGASDALARPAGRHGGDPPGGQPGCGLAGADGRPDPAGRSPSQRVAAPWACCGCGPGRSFAAGSPNLFLALLVGLAGRWCWPLAAGRRPQVAGRRRRCPASWAPTRRWTPPSTFRP